MDFSTFFTGMMMSLSLIVAIGAQNAFILRQGLRGEYILAVCLTCALSDALLIILGVTSLKQIVTLLPWLDPVMRYGGAAFLIWYGARSLRSALKSASALDVEGAPSASFGKTMATCLALTYLNPGVYLDTVVLLGSISNQFPGHRAEFAGGAASGSFLFFFALGYGATKLRPLFANPTAWRILEAAIAAIMGMIAFRLLAGV